ncbi:MAG: hypothetical protein SFU25_07180 [Candidatus Caenarcaniphilales bacterium]|nr:hypothetical protein [Candidatus Caenarcaniphilales bacterium]
MKNNQKLVALLGFTLLISSGLSMSTEACPGRFSPVRLIKKAFHAIGDGVSMGVNEVKSTFHSARNENSSYDNEYNSYDQSSNQRYSCGR